MSVMDFLNTVSQSAKVRTWERIDISNILPNNNNVYPITDLEELVNSIATIGLEQNLVVKEIPDSEKYTLITGHRRLAAIKYILDNDVSCKDNIKNEIKRPMCCVVSANESEDASQTSDELISHYRLHETNINTRRMSDSELLICIEDYLNTVKQLKEKGIKINGHELKGTTRELVSKRFGLSSGKTQQTLSVINGNDHSKQDVIDGSASINEAYTKNKEETYSEKSLKAIKKFEKQMSKLKLEEMVEMSENEFEEFSKLIKSINHYLTQIQIEYTKNKENSDAD